MVGRSVYMPHVIVFSQGLVVCHQRGRFHSHIAQGIAVVTLYCQTNFLNLKDTNTLAETSVDSLSVVAVLVATVCPDFRVDVPFVSSTPYIFSLYCGLV